LLFLIGYIGPFKEILEKNSCYFEQISENTGQLLTISRRYGEVTLPEPQNGKHGKFK